MTDANCSLATVSRPRGWTRHPVFLIGLVSQVPVSQTKNGSQGLGFDGSRRGGELNQILPYSPDSCLSPVTHTDLAEDVLDMLFDCLVPATVGPATVGL